jgi:Tfp pilus assembly protein PilV
MKQLFLSRLRQEHHQRPEAGETLIEVLMATAIMAIGVVGIVGGLATTVLGAAVHRQQANGHTVLVAAAEALKAPAVKRVPCATATEATYLAAARAALPSGWAPATLNITSIGYQNVTTSGGAASVSFGGSCQDSSGLTLQLVKLQLDVPGDRVTSKLTFIKGDQ